MLILGNRAYVTVTTISFPEAAFLLVSTKDARPLERQSQEGVMNLGLGTSAGIGE